MKWIKLLDYPKEYLERGTLLCFVAGFPFENHVVMMVCEGMENSNQKALMAITGYKAGINCYVIFPEDSTKNGLSRSWLIENWLNWVWPEGDVEQVYVLDSLKSEDIFSLSNVQPVTRPEQSEARDKPNEEA